MNPNELRIHVDRLFHDAIELPASERSTFLDRKCANLPAEARMEIDALLATDQRIVDGGAPFLESKFNLANILDPSPQEDQLLGHQIGSYKLVEQIATGGFGSVYLGQRDDEFKQRVAIKLIRSDIRDQSVIRQRFELERQVLSDLNHPFIARLLDGGTLSDARPYFVMEYVDGQSITDYCDTNQLGIDDRLRLFQKVCEAVAYAHQLAIVHRDIKPTNILVTRDGVPKLLDFGIAKLTESRSWKQGELTETGHAPLTINYASPEQCLGQSVGLSSDVYSLGVVLYELLTGKHPFRDTEIPKHELIRKICEDMPPAPSTVDYSRDHTRIEPHCVPRRRKLAGDIDNILTMALRKAPEERYLSVNHFREDIQRYFDGLPLIARKNAIIHRTVKFVRRNWIVVTGSTMIALAVSIAWWQSERLSAQLRQSLSRVEAILAYGEFQSGNLNQAKILARGHAESSDIEWKYLSSLVEENEESLVPFDTPIDAFASHIKGKAIAVLTNKSIISIDLQTRRRTVLLSLDTEDRNVKDATIRSMAFDDLGNRMVLVVKNGAGNEIEIIDLGSKHRVRVASKHDVYGLDVSADGALIAYGDGTGSVFVCDATSGETLWKSHFKQHASIDALAFSPDAACVACIGVGSESLTLTHWRGDQPKTEDQPPVLVDGSFNRHIAFSMDGDRVAVAGQQINIVNLESQPRESFAASAEVVEFVNCTDFSDDNQLIALGGAGHAVEVRNAQTFELLFRGFHNDRVHQVYFSSNGEQVASASKDEIRIWDLARKNSRWQYDGDGGSWNDAVDVSFQRDLLAMPDGPRMVLWELEDGSKTHLSGNTQPICDVSLSNYGPGFVAVSGFGGEVAVWNLSSKELVRTPFAISEHELTTIDLAPNESVFVVGGRGHCSLWNHATGDSPWFDAEPGWCNAAEFSSDGRRMFTAGGENSNVWPGEGYVRIWNVRESVPELVHELRTPGTVTTLAVSPDDSLLVVGDAKGFISLLNLQDFRLIWQKSGHTAGVSTVAFHPTKTRLVSGCWHHLLKFWDTSDGKECGTARLRDNVSAIRFLPHTRRGRGMFVAVDAEARKARIRWFGVP